ncbi:type I-G CRISPR-associated helicase/endonuclease Cas3g [Limisphaera sp. VF-2]|mgnify:CR=1 FL=1|uniref:type I-G CRISPR-associated helicase/endonuclease Cas3g n=1 Tax=Limisphaera sp. VF-2 TaxID=3400418 RepID=UPI00176A40D6
MTYRDCFAAIVGSKPYPYQVRLACGPASQPAPGGPVGVTCRSQLISIPTGMGKTAAVVMAWLWNRILHPDPEHRASWPRRLVYCLPMRTLVEQTRDNVSEWLVRLARAVAADDPLLESAVRSLPPPARERLQRDAARLATLKGPLAHARDPLLWLAKHSPIVLMGGEELDDGRRDWDLHPEKPAILIGTQDMLLSRALNRGYGMSRYRWPMHFALLNNDSLWIVDETQLMGVGFETTAQLDAFRERLRTAGAGCFTWWMSATLDEARLATTDHPRPAEGWPAVRLSSADLALPEVHRRYRAPKPLARAGLVLKAGTAKSYARQLAEFVLAKHRPNSLTLVILNRVARAQEVYQELRRLAPQRPLALVHSRFRPYDRAHQETLLREDGDRIVVATQAVEAGVDISARTLITELAPWPSLVQRFGRCNRRGEAQPPEEARVFWIDIEGRDGTDELTLPYTAEELHQARELLPTLADASPASVADAGPRADVGPVRPLLRQKDLIELFDTTPDLAGHDLDISRFIREGQDTDVHVFWRAFGDDPNQPPQPEPAATELCPVSLAQFRRFLEQLAKSPANGVEAARSVAWSWNALAEQWQRVDHPRPGGVYLLHAGAGGYSPELGWIGVEGLFASVEPVSLQAQVPSHGYSRDEASFCSAWVTLGDHTQHVVAETSSLAEALSTELSRLLSCDSSPVLEIAARWHDLGKAHEAFQTMLRGDDLARAAALWAKSAQPSRTCSRPFFRHELASALAWLQAGPLNVPERDLIAYLIAAHHGKVRMSIRSLPGEEPPPDRPEARIARGIVEGDEIPTQAFLAIGSTPPSGPLKLSLDLMEMGRNPQGEPSWLERTLVLRDRFGPFQLAFLETLLRSADARASQKEIVP